MSNDRVKVKKRKLKTNWSIKVCEGGLVRLTEKIRLNQAINECYKIMVNDGIV